jgi:hypothetical protein
LGACDRLERRGQSYRNHILRDHFPQPDAGVVSARDDVDVSAAASYRWPFVPGLLSNERKARTVFLNASYSLTFAAVTLRIYLGVAMVPVPYSWRIRLSHGLAGSQTWRQRRC